MLKRIILRAIGPFKSAVWRLCVRWPFLSDLYYAATGTFRREHRAVLLGKLRHLDDMQATAAKGGEYTLRRNTHRLEKGLISRPRRSIFARDYIGNTVDIYITLSQANDPALEALLCWTHDVLVNFFQVCGQHPAIDAALDRFKQHETTSTHCDRTTSFVPYCRDRSPLQVSYDALAQLAWRRRSVRWFLDKSVPRETIDRAIEIAKLSPSACNRQPFEFRVYDDRALAQAIGAIPGGTVGFAQNFPCVIVIVGDLRAYFSERDRHVIYVDGGLAAMSLQFALEVQGVSSCCINWPDVEQKEQEMQKALGIDTNQRPIMCMAVGYADPTGLVPYSEKKSLDQIRSYNRVC